MMPLHRILSCFVLLSAASTGVAAQAGETTVSLDGKPVLPMHGSVAGFWMFAENERVQLAIMGHPPRTAVTALDKGRRIAIRTVVDSANAASTNCESATPISAARPMADNAGDLCPCAGRFREIHARQPLD